ncbi:hypothetical protein PUR57_07565 [Streptomyces sp. JV176]|uniref:hypothetical protein n=1 Tax=Streptomyces sp. JV176 TaxID=858630 RepID=UPI002E778E56|nr:hypothetical protein [Streptomyces sp. JV176]MEE1798535.1 hypothetical protein [Streptomyces sp. JV176]
MGTESARELDPQADPQWFIGQLRRLMTACGAGTATRLGGRKKNQPTDKEVFSHSTISRALSPFIQSTPTADFTRRFVERCTEYADEHAIVLSSADRDVEYWLELLAAVDEEIKEAARLATLDLAMLWSELADLDDWRKSSETSLIPPLGMSFTVQDRLTALRLWMAEAEWPKPFSKVASAIGNFHHVLGDLLDFFTSNSTYSTQFDEYYVLLDHSLRFDYGPERLRAEREYLLNIDLFVRLWFELTAAGNHVCDAVRDELDGAFRLGKGRIATIHGPDSMGRCQITRWVYSADTRHHAHPYPGFEALREALRVPTSGGRERERLIDESGAF